MDKRTTGTPSKSFTGATIEVSKRGQHLLSQMRASYCSLRHGLQGWQSSHHGLGKPSTGETEARIRRAKVSRTQADRQDNEEGPREIENSNLQGYAHAIGCSAEKVGGWW